MVSEFTEGSNPRVLEPRGSDSDAPLDGIRDRQRYGLDILSIYGPEVKQLALVTVRVPEYLRKEMRKLRSVNWSALLREAIQTRVELEQQVTKDMERVRRGSRRADAVRREIRRRHGYIDFDSAETIRYWRERRSRGISRTPQLH